MLYYAYCVAQAIRVESAAVEGETEQKAPYLASCMHRHFCGCSLFSCKSPSLNKARRESCAVHLLLSNARLRRGSQAISAGCCGCLAPGAPQPHGGVLRRTRISRCWVPIWVTRASASRHRRRHRA